MKEDFDKGIEIVLQELLDENELALLKKIVESEGKLNLKDED